MPNLFDIEMALVEALEGMLESTDETNIPEETQALFRGYLQTAMEKRDRVASFIEASEGRADTMEAEAARILRRAAALRNATDRLKGFVVSVMRATDQKKLAGMVRTLAIQQNPVSVEVVGDVPEKYLLPQKPAPARMPDKRKIKQDLESGYSVPNSRLVPGQFRLVIR